MSNKILVTGATGTLGSEIVRQLSSKGESVRAAVRNPDKARDIGLGNVMLVHWDYKKTDSFAPALENADRVVLIAPSATPNQDKYLIPAMNAAKKHGVKHIVLISVLGANASDENALRKCELHLQSLGVDYTILRPNWLMQNFSGTMAPGIKEAGAIYLPAGDGKTSFIDARDVAAVVTKVFADKIHLKKEYDISGSEALDHVEVVKRIGEAAGKEVTYHDIPADQFKTTLLSYGMTEEAVGFMAELYGYVKAGYSAAVTDSVQKITGRAPIPFDTFAKDHADAWK